MSLYIQSELPFEVFVFEANFEKSVIPKCGSGAVDSLVKLTFRSDNIESESPPVYE